MPRHTAKRQLQGRLALQINRARANIRNASPWLPSLTRQTGDPSFYLANLSWILVNPLAIRVIEKKNLISSSLLPPPPPPETFSFSFIFSFLLDTRHELIPHFLVGCNWKYIGRLQRSNVKRILFCNI